MSQRARTTVVVLLKAGLLCLLLLQAAGLAHGAHDHGPVCCHASACQALVAEAGATAILSVAPLYSASLCNHPSPVYAPLERPPQAA